jgi:hypothetical protein
MQRQVKFGLGLLAGVLVGCSMATGPLSPPPLPDNPATAANVTVYRQTAGEDEALRMVFTINDAGTYQLSPGERYSFVMPAGTYGFGYRLGMSKCSDEVKIDAGGNYVFKLAAGCNIILESQ